MKDRLYLSHRAQLILRLMSAAAALAMTLGAPHLVSRAAFYPPCENPGWFPVEFGLKDHYIFWHDGYYYLISIYLPFDNPPQPPEDRFTYARSQDLCSWESLAPVLPTRLPGTWDEKAIWAPFVYQEGDTYYLYYTGVTNDYTQSILLATTTDPAAPDSWEKQDTIFQPDHPGMLWTEGTWADCRDPTLVKVGDLYYLYYSARDQTGGIIGVATAPSPTGPWSDQGSIIQPIANGMPESPTVVRYESWYYLFYNLSQVGSYYRMSESPTGPWQTEVPFRPGWAHEVWQDILGDWLTSYLTDYTVTIAPLTWNGFVDPARPFIGLITDRIHLPVIFSPQAPLDRSATETQPAFFEGDPTPMPDDQVVEHIDIE